jgi:NitT/TauT family transport system substrate-binding protein
VTISYDNAAGNFLPLFIARGEGYFKANGLDVNLVESRASAALLISGNAQFAVGGGSGFINAKASGGDIEFIGALENHFTAVLIAGPEIKGPADLRGKKLGLSSPGGLVDLEGRVLLKANGLSPETTQIVYIQSLTGRSAALLSGSIDALVGSPDPTLYSHGMKEVFDLGKYYYLSVALSTTKKYADANPTVVSGYLKSLIQAIQWLNKPANRTEALAYDKQLTGKSDPKQLASDVDHYTPTFDPRLQISRAALGNTIQSVAKSGGGTVDPDEMVDSHFLEGLIDSGWMDKAVPPIRVNVKLRGTTLALTNTKGQALTHLTPGRYQFVVSDTSRSGSVKLTGPNETKRSTGVKQKGTARWILNVVRGKYRFSLSSTPAAGKTIKVS